MRTGGLLIAGTTSDAGKSVVTAALCRWLARQGVRVAPFKAQNMSNNSAVTAAGAEIGRAQAMQAAAAGVPAEAAMNPVLLKPGSDRESQVVVMGRPLATASATSYQTLKKQLFETVLGAYDDLRSRFDAVVCEGAGSPAEINLRENDLVNLGLARARNLPALVVGDIDRGGVLAAFHGTVALLDAADQALICGFIVNKFRGDQSVLDPGLRMIEGFTGRPVLGVLPYLRDVWLDAEDALVLDGRPTWNASAPVGPEPLAVTVVYPPRISNFTDIDALMLEPGVEVSFTTSGRGIAEADLVILPGTKATVSDLDWLRRRGIADALARRAAAGGVILGVCGGYQMLGRRIEDEVESRAGTVDGLGLLPVTTRFAAAKTLARPVGRGLGEAVRTAYEIHHGTVTVEGGESLFRALGADEDSGGAAPTGSGALRPAAAGSGGAGAPLDGCIQGSVLGTLWHGALESDGFRRAFLSWTAARAGRSFIPAPDTDFAAARTAQYDRLADAVAEHLDTAAVWRLLEQGPTPGLSLLPPGARRPVPGGG
jgi:adenosylcobyric acid synthase